MQRDRRMNSSGFSRNGRFSYSNTTSGTIEYSIIKTGSQSVYRFFNSGESAFKVNVVSSSGGGVTVDPRNSIDAEITGEVTIKVASGTTVEGIYEFVENNSGVRNGRYSGELKKTNHAPIIYGRDGSVYRIFNSGENAFNIVCSGVTTELEPRESQDFVVKGIVKLTTDTTDKVRIRAIYDYLDTNKPIRSGRFKHESIDSTTVLQHEIINFSQYINPPAGKAKPFLLYRVFNSGEGSIKLIAKSSKTSTNGVELTTLEPDQSFDFGFNADGYPNNMDANKAIWINSVDHSKSIQGIYEYLGAD